MKTPVKTSGPKKAPEDKFTRNSRMAATPGMPAARPKIGAPKPAARVIEPDLALTVRDHNKNKKRRI